jgi:hypothetical protein
MDTARALEQYLQGTSPDPDKGFELCRLHLRELEKINDSARYFRLKENPK